MKNYIGIAGIANRENVEAVMEQINKISRRAARTNIVYPSLALGVLVSRKTLNGALNKYPNKYPKIGLVSDLFVDSIEAINVIHYSSDSKGVVLLNELCQVAELSEKLDAIQLNIAWPEPGVLVEFKQLYRNVNLILQVPVSEVLENPHISKPINAVALQYNKVVDKFLIDFSRGFGQPLDLDKLEGFIQQFKAVGINECRLGAAGGLSPDKPEVIREIMERHPHFSIDAESGLRDNPSIGGGFINLNKVDKFINIAIGAVDKNYHRMADPFKLNNRSDCWGGGTDDSEDGIVPPLTNQFVVIPVNEADPESVQEETNGMFVRRIPKGKETVNPEDPSWTDDDGIQHIK